MGGSDQVIRTEVGMALRFSVLASGSSGNASLVEANGFGVLLDVGLGPRQLNSRLATIDRNWTHIHAVVLTHTHADHWNEGTFAQLRRLGIPIYCHADHHMPLRMASLAFGELRGGGLVRDYQPGQALQLSPTLACTPLPVWHDDTTCGFRFEAAQDLFGPSTLGYAADLGTWQPELIDAFANVDILALEFNHDVFLERASGRSPELILRVLGDRGHLSNVQAANLFREVLERSQPGRPQHLVQLHLSRQCNRPAMAVDAARVVVKELQAEVEIHTARQNNAGPSLTIDGSVPKTKPLPNGRRRRESTIGTLQHSQPLLPGWEEA
jgi:phosphoribosyl 1,2-cyclic phosphodiesterase